VPRHVTLLAGSDTPALAFRCDWRDHGTAMAKLILQGSLLVVLLAQSANAKTITVGPGKQYPTPCAAAAAAADGDLIEIDAAGNYDGNVCAISKNNLTLRGVGGRAQIDAAGSNAQGKAIWVVTGNDTVIENIEFTGAAVPDMNGAGIRQEGTNLTVRNCVFRDNENGILAGDKAGSEILIEFTEFDHNGAGDGFSHNLYINHVAKLTFRHNWSHRAQIGHLLKSRAAETHVLYNRLTGESDGTQSYEIDVPNGGKTYVIGNLVEQGSQTDNPSMLAYRAEGAHAANPSDELFVVNNTFVNDRGSGTFVNVGGSVTTPVVLKNNIFFGGGTITNQGSAVQANNYSGSTSCLVGAASFDYQLAAGTPCVNAGADPGSGGGLSLLPAFHYVHPTASQARSSAGTIDIGAYELGGGSSGTGGTGGSGTGGSGTGGTGTGGAGTGGSGTGGTGGTGTGGDSGAGTGGAGTGGNGTGGTATGGTGAGGTGTGGVGGTAGAGGGPSTGGTSAGGTSAGGTGTGGKAANQAGDSSEDEGGCGCRVAANPRHAGWLFAVAALGLSVLRRRGRSQPQK
jgi:MYXO-CTERM domain-containing protein